MVAFAMHMGSDHEQVANKNTFTNMKDSHEEFVREVEHLRLNIDIMKTWAKRKFNVANRISYFNYILMAIEAIVIIAVSL